MEWLPCVVTHATSLSNVWSGMDRDTMMDGLKTLDLRPSSLFSDANF